jgi:TonB family protein
MNRLQKKCVIVSTGLHALLVGILLFGSAFFNSQPKDEQHPLLTAFDPSMINALLTKGGNPNVAVVPPPANRPPAPPSQDKPQEVSKPVEPPKVKRVVYDEPEPPVRRFSDNAPPPKPRKRETLTADELKLTKPRKAKTNKPKQPTESTTRDSDDTARRESQQFARSLRSLNKELSTGTTEDFKGIEGGPLSASYRDVIANMYNSAWSSPPDLTDESAKDIVSVTIARDGRVVNGRIIQRSGNEPMDRSIQNMLDTVTVVPPFPEGYRESQRTFEIVLSLRTKR